MATLASSARLYGFICKVMFLCSVLNIGPFLLIHSALFQPTKLSFEPPCISSRWGILFLEIWKRNNYTLAYQWDCDTFESSEPDRPEFLGTDKLQVNWLIDWLITYDWLILLTIAKMIHRLIQWPVVDALMKDWMIFTHCQDPITGELAWTYPLWRRIRKFIISGTFVAFFVGVVFVSVILVILFKVQ